VIDMTGLRRVGEMRAGRVTVQAGALWSEVLDADLLSAAGQQPLAPASLAAERADELIQAIREDRDRS
jgi:hypothetical protein